MMPKKHHQRPLIPPEEALEGVAAVVTMIILEWHATFAALITDITKVNVA
jgi:hypothetical protein